MEALASAVAHRPGKAVLQVPKKVLPMAVWRKYGLLAHRFTGAQTVSPRVAALPREIRFRLALEEGGETLALFGQYLAGRADLLPSTHLRELGKIRIRTEPRARTVIDRELGGRISQVHPVRVEAGREIYIARAQGRKVVVEAYDDRADESSIDKALGGMSREVRALRNEPESSIAQPSVLDHFREWLLLQCNIERKRAILQNLELSPSNTVCRYPRVIPELQSPRCLSYEAMEGAPLAFEPAQSAASIQDDLGLAVEGLLDQSLFLSLIDAEMHFDNYLALPEGRLGFSWVPALAPVPVEWNYELLQYMASTVAGDSPRALHMLSRISSNTDPFAQEQHLLRELSSLQPELKINLVTPESVTAMENYWRALANTRMIAPLFLELFHRQWVIIGQYNGDMIPKSDLIAESLWPVVARILRLRFSETMSFEKGKEWVAGSGLLFLGAARQVGATLEQVRDNDLAVVLDQQASSGSDARSNRRVGSLIRSGVALVVFLLALQVALNSRGSGLQLAAGITAIVSAVILSIFVARIE
ncbi:MAG TPA: hypothetical protein VE398_14320 [Acidobacteriota bacterium]|nr:hypothetical protein [Acidobacteriota bacterium]